MDEKINLSKGGKCIVLMGNGGFVQEYAANPQIEFLKCKEIPNDGLNTLITTDTKVAILTDGVPEYHYLWVTSYCRRQNIPFLIRKSNQHIYETLKGFFPNGTNEKPSVEEIKETESKGKLLSLIPFIDWNKSNAENARFLIRKCNENGIKSTHASLAQWMAVQRRKQSGNGIPKSARSKLDLSVDLLDNMIQELTDMRDFLISTCEENRVLKTKLDKFRKAMDE